MTRILVVRAGALGDTLLTLPALRALRRWSPTSHLTVAGSPDTVALLGDVVDRCLSVDTPALAGLVGGRPTVAALDLVGAHDLIVVWSSRAPHPAFRQSGVRIIQATPYPPPGMHAAAWLARTLGLPLEPLSQPLPLPTSAKPAIGGVPPRPVVLHPGAGARWKRWPAAHFAALADALWERGHGVTLLAGPADEEAIAEVRARLAHPVPTLHRLPLCTVATVLARAAAYVGNDSGISHLAALAGAPTIALFGPTDPANWAPLGDVQVLRRCTRQARRQGQIRVCDHLACLDAVNVAQVLHAVDTVLKRCSAAAPPVDIPGPEQPPSTPSTDIHQPATRPLDT